jgi:phosphoribosylformylglycinamidine synthase
VALAECCVTGPARLGAKITLSGPGRWDALLFGEAPSRIVVSVPPAEESRFAQIVREWAIPTGVLGRVGGRRLTVTVRPEGPDGAEPAASRIALDVDVMAEAFDRGLSQEIEAVPETPSGPRAEGPT